MTTCSIVIDFRACYGNDVDDVSVAGCNKLGNKSLGHAQAAQHVGVVPASRERDSETRAKKVAEQKM
jgi:hypothetical protein